MLEKVLRATYIDNKIQGILYYLLCCLSFVIVTVILKYTSVSNPYIAIFFRDVVCLILSGLWIYFDDKKLFYSSQKSLQFIRSIASFIGIVFWFIAVKSIPLAEATALNLTVPIFSTIIALIFLKEQLKLSRLTAIIIGSFGAYVIVNPQFNDFNIGYILAILSAFMFSIYNNIVRFLTFYDNPKTIIFYFFLYQTIICIPFIYQDFVMPSLHDSILMILIGIFAAINVYTHALAFKKTEISFVESFDFSRLIFASMFGFILFNETINARFIIGALFIVFAAIFVIKKEKLKNHN